MAGALILSRLPGHRLGWLYCLCGLACSVTLASNRTPSAAWSTARIVPGRARRGLGVVVDLDCGFRPLMTLGVLWFPDGRLPSRRWWPVAAVVA